MGIFMDLSSGYLTVKPLPIEMDDKNDDLPNFNIVILQILTPRFVGWSSIWAVKNVGKHRFRWFVRDVVFRKLVLKHVYFWHKSVLVAIWGWSGGKGRFAIICNVPGKHGMYLTKNEDLAEMLYGAQVLVCSLINYCMAAGHYSLFSCRDLATKLAPWLRTCQDFGTSWTYQTLADLSRIDSWKAEMKM